MSKLRQQLDLSHLQDDLIDPAEGDLHGYVVFTQLKTDGPFIYAGWLDAPDEAMAVILAKEHYGQDQPCTAIWVVPREFVGGLRENADAAAEPVAAPREYQIFTQENAGDQHFSSITITASCAADAIASAREQIEGGQSMHNLWAVPVEKITATREGEVIWRETDQTYRLARGYSKDVREKWEKIRAERDLIEYEKDDLTETF